MGLTKPRAAQIFNLDYKQSTRVVTITNINLSGGAPNSVDGVNLSLGDRVLVIGQSTGTQNGLYQVTTLGSGSNGTWARTSDGNENGEIEAGMIVMVTEGAIYADTQWKLITDDPITIGSTALVYTQNYLANSISSGTSNVVVNSNANVTISSAGTANVVSVGSTAVTFTGNLFPSANVTYTLGNTALRWKDLWLANSSLYIGDVTVATSGSVLTVNGANVLTGNAGAAFSTSGNITGGNLLTSGLVSATGNIQGGNVLTAGLISSTGNVTGGNIITGGTVYVTSNVSATGNVRGGNINTTGLVTATGNVTGGNVNTVGNVSATGNIAGNYLLANIYFATGFSASRIFNGTSEANIGTSGGNANISIGGVSNVVVFATTGQFLTGLLSVTGNITGGNIAATNHTGTNVSVTGTVTTASTVGGVITGSSTSVTGTQTATSTVGGVITGSSVSVTGTATAASTVGGVITGSSASLSGNISGGNLNITGNIVDTGALFLITGSSGNVTLAPNGTNVIVATTTGANITGTLNVTGNTTLSVLSVSSVTGGSISISGGVTAASVVGGVITGSSASVSGTVTGASVVGGAMTGSSISVTGTVTGASVVGGVMTGSSLSVSGNVTGGNLNTGAQVVATGNITGGNLRTAGLISATGNLTVGGDLNLVGNIVDTGPMTLITTSNGNITLSPNGTGIVIASGNISTAGNVIAGNILTNGYYYANGVVFGGGGGGTPGGANTQIQFNDNGAFGGNGQFVYNKVTNIVTAGAFAGNTNGTGQNFQVGDDAWFGDINVADTVGLKGQQNGANGYIVFGNSDSTGRLGRAGTGPLTYAGSFSITGTVTGASVVGGVMTGTSLSVSGNVSGGNLIVTGNIVDTGALSIITGSNGNIALTPNGTGIVTASSSISTSGNITAVAVFSNGQISSTGNVFAPNVDVSTGTVFCGNIVNNNANAVGNIGSSAKYFNTVFAKATSAQYADLAEMYLADADYAPGTVVEFGGTAEITQSTSSHSTQVAGIISTNPSYLMNATIHGSLALPVALVGRVPCRIVGNIAKGDRLVASDIPGVATALDVTKYQPACIVGKSLENYNSTQVGVIEVAVGRT